VYFGLHREHDTLRDLDAWGRRIVRRAPDRTRWFSARAHRLSTMGIPFVRIDVRAIAHGRSAGSSL